MYGNYPDLKDVKRILIIKLRHLGDVLLTSPVFTSLKRSLPHAEIDAYIYKESHPMLEGHPAMSKFFLYDRGWKKLSFFRRCFQEWKLLKEIRKQRYDLVINLTEGDRGAIAALISGARYRLGFDPEGKGFIAKKKIYTHTIKSCSTFRHAVERNLDAVRVLGIFPAIEERKLSFHIPETAFQKMETLLGDHHYEKQEYLLIQPISRWKFKSPPPKLFAQFIHEMVKQGCKKIILSGGPDEQERQMIQQIISQVDLPVLNLAGKLSLKELGALIAWSRCLVTIDSVALHLASALEAPVVVLFGPTSEKNWGPWMHPHAKVVAQKVSCRPCLMDGCGGSKMSDCLYTLDPKWIANEAQTLMKESNHPLHSEF